MEAMMADRPINLRAYQVQAALADRLSQTRRLQGLKDVNASPDAWSLHSVGPLGYMAKDSVKGKFGATFESRQIEPGTLHICPQVLPFAIGDRLWCREAWAKDGECPFQYKAGPHFADDARGVSWRSPIHMPRWASRLTLVVTDVRVQRLWGFNEADAQAEGVEPVHEPDNNQWEHYLPYRVAFRDLWNRIHGPDAWKRNDWVAAVTFTTRQCNIDQMEKADD
jgi:hypothetical protein